MAGGGSEGRVSGHGQSGPRQAPASGAGTSPAGRYAPLSARRERSVTVAGVSCRVWEQGTGPPVAFLPGIGGLPRWSGFLEALARGRRVVAPSLPGFPGAAALAELDDQLDWLLATHDLLRAADGAGGDLVGVSLGVCRIGRTEEAKECWSGLQSDYGLHESMLSQIVGLGYPLPPT